MKSNTLPYQENYAIHQNQFSNFLQGKKYMEQVLDMVTIVHWDL